MTFLPSFTNHFTISQAVSLATSQGSNLSLGVPRLHHQVLGLPFYGVSGLDSLGG